MQELYSTLSV